MVSHSCISYFEQPLKQYEDNLILLKRSKKTIKGYIKNLTLFFGYVSVCKEIYDVREITVSIINDYQLHLKDHITNLNTLYPRLNVIRLFFRFIVDNQIILIDPTEKMILPPLGDRLPHDIPTVKEMIKLLSMPHLSTDVGVRNRAILELLYSSGIRLGECLRLNVYDIDYKGGCIRVTQGKGSKDRMVPIGKKACEYLKLYLLNVRPKYISKSAKNIDEKALFLSSKDGTSLSDISVQLMIKEYRRKAKIQTKITAHAIRRAFATHLLQNDAHPLYVQRLLGHSSSYTLRNYIKVTGKEVKQTHKKTHPRERDKR